MHYTPQDGKWQVGPKAKLLHELRQKMAPSDYEQHKRALQEFLCGYFSTGECANAQGASIAPMKATPRGGKVLKVRWAYPGCGKSGSLRLVVVAYCQEKRVHVAQAFDRREDPTDEEFRDACKRCWGFNSQLTSGGLLDRDSGCHSDRDFDWRSALGRECPFARC